MKFLQILAGLLLFALVIAATWFGATFLWQTVRTQVALLDETTAAILGLATLAACGCTLLLVLSLRWILNQPSANQARAERRAVYAAALAYWRNAAKDGVATLDLPAELEARFLLHANRRPLRFYMQRAQIRPSAPAANGEFGTWISAMIAAMRSDLGLFNADFDGAALLAATGTGDRVDSVGA